LHDVAYRLPEAHRPATLPHVSLFDRLGNCLGLRRPPAVSQEPLYWATSNIVTYGHFEENFPSLSVWLVPGTPIPD
jgi:hypothetical protein